MNVSIAIQDIKSKNSGVIYCLIIHDSIGCHAIGIITANFIIKLTSIGHQANISDSVKQKPMRFKRFVPNVSNGFWLFLTR
jgi:hypothetical protein